MIPTFLRLDLILLLTLASAAHAQVWRPDLGNGRYRNPIIYADYSDPDVIRVGDDYYLVASSFNAVPALPILHSRDLVNWQIINHAIPRLPSDFDVVQHGNGVWAPSLRYHDGAFYVYFGDPDRGIFMVKTRDIRGSWDPPILARQAKGWIDPAPFWDDDGNAYLVHAFANSRAGIKSVLHVNRMSADGTRLLDDGTLVFDGHEHHPTIEGPKLYKRNGYYYIFAPAGGVPTGWQTVLRSRNVLGPYEPRIVLAQGFTAVNGPHQGAWIETPNGDSWFVHFQDRGPYGRITHLQPVAWKDDWPVMGVDRDGDGVGEPVLEFAKPRAAAATPRTSGDTAGPQTSDEFDGVRLGLQWQWQANDQPGWYSLTESPGVLRLFAQPLPAGATNLWPAPNLLLQKLPAPAFTVTTRVSLTAKDSGGVAGLIVFGMDYAYIGLRRTATGIEVVESQAKNAHEGGAELMALPARVEGAAAYLRVTVADGAVCRFAYSLTGNKFTPIGVPFQAREGRWVGAKVGLFARRAAAGSSPASEHADFDFFRVQP
jgi:beta-xylosidase